MLLIEELEKGGCLVEFVERPMSQDPHDQLLLQICGAVAEYERNLIADRTRRGYLQKYRAVPCPLGDQHRMAIALTPSIHVIQ
jgi:site-specific DNA recombinase